MRQRFSVSIGIGLIAVALSVVVVGTVWAGSSALSFLPLVGSTDSTVPANSPESDTDESEDADTGGGDETVTAPTNSELAELVASLDEQVQEQEDRHNELEKVLDTLSRDVGEMNKRVSNLAQKVDAFPLKLINELVIDVDKLEVSMEDVVNRLVVTEGRVKNLTTDGVYTGLINPNQLSRKLTAVDLAGDWPLDRVSGELNINQLKTDSSSCMSDYRNNAFFAFDVFRRPTCIKILK